MSLDNSIRALWGRVGPQQRWAFFSCALTGYLVHLYAFTNLIPNSDGLSRMFDPQQMTVSGRWFLHYVSAFNGFTQMPAVIAFFSVLFLSLAAALTASVLGLRGRALAAATGALMASFPALGYTFLYLFTASAYCLAILLAVLSVWLARRGKLGWLLGVCALALAMGTYQAYAAAAIALSLLVVLRETFRPEATLKGTFRLGVRLAAYLAAGAVLYYVILLIFLKVKNLELLSYLGMDAASSGYPFAKLPGLIFAAYKQVIALFLLPGAANSFTGAWLAGLDVLALIIGAALLLGLLLREKREGWRIAGALAMLALLPLGVNFGQILSPYSAPTPLMKYAFVAVYLAVLVLADLSDGAPLPVWGRGLACLCAAGLLVVFLNTNNLLYTSSAQAHRAAESYATRLLSRVESCPGYTGDEEVVIIGGFPADRFYSDVESYRLIAHYSVPVDTVLPLNKHIYYYFNDWLNVPIPEPDEETMLEVAASEEFAQMPLYPADGSVAMLDGRVVVKVQETYTPKSDFEIAYENRR